MQNTFEEMPAGSSEEEKKLTQKEIDELAELELADKIYQSSKINEVIKGNILDVIDFYIKFINSSEELEEKLERENANLSREAIEKIIGVNLEKAKGFVDSELTILAEKINTLIKEEKLSVSQCSSLTDTINNSIITGMGAVRRTMKEIEAGKVKSHEDLTEDRIKMLEILEKAFSEVPYYLNELCSDERKLEMELAYQNGYLEKFKNYFFEKEVPKGENRMVVKRIYPIGASKIAYFRFFNEWDQRNVKQENLEKELGKMDDKFVDKGKIREDFKKKRQPQAS